MIPRLARETDAAPNPNSGAARSTDLVDGWLRVFLGLLRVPAAQAAGIREELEGHLRERVRDLMLSGTAEGEATRQAISELGEAADVAARYRALRTEPRRRLIMYGTMFAAVGAALALSIAAFTQPPADEKKTGEEARTAALQAFLVDALTRPQPQVEHPWVLDLLPRARNSKIELVPELRLRAEGVIRAAQAAAGSAVYQPQILPPELAGLHVDWELDSVSLGDAFKYLEASAGLPVTVQWPRLGEAGIEQGAAVSVRAKGAGPGALLRAVNEMQGTKGARSVECRVTDGVIEVSTREYFDQRERELVSYDLSKIIAHRSETYNDNREKVLEEVQSAITQFVSPEDWRDNGGDLAEMSVVGDRLFVKAPARLHPQIRWILSQLPSGDQKDKAEPAPRGQSAEPEVRIYAIKHKAANDVLCALKEMDSIRAIDFSRFTYDSRTNAVIAWATPEQQLALQVAIDGLDRPAARAKPEAAVQTKLTSSGEVVYLTGTACPGTYSLPDNGITLRKLLAAAGGLPGGATQIVISDSRDGNAVVVHRLEAGDLRRDDGPDPVVTEGQLVSVR